MSVLRVLYLTIDNFGIRYACGEFMRMARGNIHCYTHLILTPSVPKQISILFLHLQPIIHLAIQHVIQHKVSFSARRKQGRCPRWVVEEIVRFVVVMILHGDESAHGGDKSAL